MDKTMLKARVREERGSRASRKLRRTGEIPAILAGHGEDPVAVAVVNHDLEVAARSEGHLITLELGSEEVEVLIRDIQYDAFGEKVLHVDFDRVVRGQTLELEIPIEFFGEAVGVVDEGGVFQVLLDEVRVSCLPRAIPEQIEVDIRALGAGHEIRLSELDLPEGVTLVETETDELVCRISLEEEEEEEEEESLVDEVATSPEVIARGKEKEEGEEGND